MSFLPRSLQCPPTGDLYNFVLRGDKRSAYQASLFTKSVSCLCLYQTSLQQCFQSILLRRGTNPHDMNLHPLSDSPHMTSLFTYNVSHPPGLISASNFLLITLGTICPNQTSLNNLSYLLWFKNN